MGTIGAYSFQVNSGMPDWGIDFDVNFKNVVEICKTRKIDLLVCAGFALKGRAMVDSLYQELRQLKYFPVIVIEGTTETIPPTTKDAKKNKKKFAIIYSICSKRGVRSIGQQVFSVSADINDRTLKELSNASDNRVISIPGDTDHDFFLLSCGEIHTQVAKEGEEKPTFRQGTPERLREHLSKENRIYLNPTHDVMRREIRKKRYFLSSGPGRGYFGVANWNIDKNQSPESSIHVFMLNGIAQPSAPPESVGAGGAMYSEFKY